VADDIVTRLRSAGKCLDGHICSKCDREVRDDMGCKCVCHDYPWGDAADEIERLRHIVENVNTYLHLNAFSGPNEDGDEDNNYPIIRMEIWFQQLLKEEANHD
jgi:hypothetical protein